MQLGCWRTLATIRKQPQVAWSTRPMGRGALAIFPFSGSRMDETKEFISCHSFRVQVVPHGFLVQVHICAVQCSQDLRGRGKEPRTLMQTWAHQKGKDSQRTSRVLLGTSRLRMEGEIQMQESFTEIIEKNQMKTYVSFFKYSFIFYFCFFLCFLLKEFINTLGFRVTANAWYLL